MIWICSAWESKLGFRWFDRSFIPCEWFKNMKFSKRNFPWAQTNNWLSIATTRLIEWYSNWTPITAMCVLVLVVNPKSIRTTKKKRLESNDKYTPRLRSKMKKITHRHKQTIQFFNLSQNTFRLGEPMKITHWYKNTLTLKWIWKMRVKFLHCVWLSHIHSALELMHARTLTQAHGEKQRATHKCHRLMCVPFTIATADYKDYCDEWQRHTR